MTTLYPESKKCCICGNESEHLAIGSTNCFGVSDLDLRPAEMQRSTMSHWIQYCPKCGYVAEDLEEEPAKAITPQIIKAIYKEGTCAPRNMLAKRFYKKYLLDKYYGNTEDAYYSALHCAWACDDKNETDNAAELRKLALVELEKVIKAEKDEEYKVNLLLCKADLLRRSGQFARVKEEYSDMHFDNELLDRIIAFQLAKSEEKDDKCYTVKDV